MTKKELREIYKKKRAELTGSQREKLQDILLIPLIIYQVLKTSATQRVEGLSFLCPLRIITSYTQPLARVLGWACWIYLQNKNKCWMITLTELLFHLMAQRSRRLPTTTS